MRARVHLGGFAGLWRTDFNHQAVPWFGSPDGTQHILIGTRISPVRYCYYHEVEAEKFIGDTLPAIAVFALQTSRRVMDLSREVHMAPECPAMIAVHLPLADRCQSLPFPLESTIMPTLHKH